MLDLDKLLEEERRKMRERGEPTHQEMMEYVREHGCYCHQRGDELHEYDPEQGCPIPRVVTKK